MVDALNVGLEDDAKPAAEAVARGLRIDEVFAQVLPEEKMRQRS